MNARTVYDIIGLWPRRADLAADLSEESDSPVDVHMVHKWAKNGIPAWWQAKVLKAAQKRGFDVTADEMLLAHAEKGTAA